MFSHKKDPRRSTLSKPTLKDDDEPNNAAGPLQKRRISFSGKKFVREFKNDEKTHEWGISYELSDRTNGDDSTGAGKKLYDASNSSDVGPEKENDFSVLNLQGSIDVTLFPSELQPRGQRLSANEAQTGLRQSFSTSISMTPVLRTQIMDKLSQQQVLERTMDLLPNNFKSESLELSPVKQAVWSAPPLAGDSFMDITPVAMAKPASPEAQSGLMEQNSADLEREMRDFMEHTNQSILGNAPAHFESSLETADGSLTNSPLIPLDMISGQGVSRKLNFRQLNDGLEAGNIQIFPNGPKTPTTDKKGRQPKFWTGLGGQDEQPGEAGPLRNLKPRGTLNFSESPAPNPAKQQNDHKRKYHLSQADEMMLDNTNFLAHAQLGDETQSRNSTRRGESTFNNNFEWDSEREPELAEGRPIINRMEVMDEAKPLKSRRTLHLNESMDQETSFKTMEEKVKVTAKTQTRQTLIMEETIGLDEQVHKSSRKTLILNEAIENDMSLEYPSPLPVQEQKSRPRHTLLLAEAIDEDVVMPNKDLAKRLPSRSTLIMSEPIEEDKSTERLRSETNQTSDLPQQHKYSRSKLRSTLVMSEPIQEDEIRTSRNTLLMSQSIEEDMIASPAKQHKPKSRHTLITQEPLEEEPETGNKNVPFPADIQHLRFKSRNTLLMSEPIKEDDMGASVPEYQKSKPRNTLLLSESIKEDGEADYMIAPPIKQLKPKSRHTLIMQEPLEEEPKTVPIPSKSRNTLLMSEPIQEDEMCNFKDFSTTKNPQSKSRNTLLMSESIKEDGEAETVQQKPKPESGTKNDSRCKPRSTLIMSEPIQEDKMGSSKDVPMAKDQKYKSRNTLLMSESIEEDREADYMIAPPTKQQKSKSRNTLIMQEPLDEEPETVPIPSDTKHSRSKPRSTLLMSEPMQEDEICGLKDFSVLKHPKSKSRNTLLMSESIEEIAPPTKPQITSIKQKPLEEEPQIATEYTKCKSRSTLIMSEPIQEDRMEAFKDFSVSKNQKSKSRNTLLMSESMEEDAEADYMIAPPSIHRKTKSRNTLIMQEPLQEDLETVPIPSDFPPSKSKSRDTLLMSEPIQEDEMCGFKDFPVAKDQKSKSRNTLLMSQSIEEDAEGCYMMAPPIKQSNPKSRNTLIMQEPLEEEPAIGTKNVSIISDTKHLKFQPRSTLIMSEPILEDKMGNSKDVPMATDQKSKSRNTLLLSESIEEDAEALYKQVEPYSTISAKSRSTLIMSEPIQDINFDSEPIQESTGQDKLTACPISHLNKTTKPLNRTVVLEEYGTPCGAVPLDEDRMVPSKDFDSTKLEQFKARKTLILSEAIEEDVMVTSVNENKNPKTRSMEEDLAAKFRSTVLGTDPLKQDVKELKSRNTILMVEPMEEDTSPSRKLHRVRFSKTLIRAEPMEEDSPCKRTPQEPEPIEVDDISLAEEKENFGSPPRHNRQSFYPITPGRSLIEFENEEECAEAYQSINMDLDQTPNASQRFLCNQAKRLPLHLTPNLPLSKKRQTHLFQGEQMEEEGAWGGRPHMNEHLDQTVQVVRDVKKSSKTVDMLQTNTFEDKAITISDVSNYFEAQREILKQRQSVSGEGIKTYNKIIDLSGDTTVFPIMDEAVQSQQLDNVRLSLVSTLAEEEDDVDLVSEEEEEEEQEPEASPARNQTVSTRQTCCNCRCAESNTTVSTDSFVLPTYNEWDFSKERQRLDRLRQRPHLVDVHRYYQVEHEDAELTLMNVDSDEEVEQDVTSRDSEFTELLLLIESLPERIKRQQLSKPTITQQPQTTFFQQLSSRLKDELPHWIFDYQLKISRKIIFTHSRLVHCRVVMLYDYLDELDQAIRIRSILLEPAPVTDDCTEIDHVLDFQLSLKLPGNLLPTLEGHNVESLMKLLQRLNDICLEIKERNTKFLKVLTATSSMLIRQHYRNVVRRTIRKRKMVDVWLKIEKIDFMVEITNLEEISFENIIEPQLYMFNENIQFLPKGIAFLEAFLPNPEQYLKESQ